jgi:hypothetical protein
VIAPAKGLSPVLRFTRSDITHVSLWRANDRKIVAGDAFITTRMESAYAVTVQKPEMHGPPMYFTTDFEAAKRSVQMLAKLEPELAVTGHGRAMQEPEMRTALHLLAENFDRYAVPKNGRYVKAPAIVSDGTPTRSLKFPMTKNAPVFQPKSNPL